MTDRRRFFSLILALALGVAIAYLPAMYGGWVWDDLDLVKPSPALLDLDGLGRAITTDLYRQANPRLEPSSYWRPLALASYWLDSRLGAPPFTLHVGNILLHGLATALLSFVALRPLQNGRSHSLSHRAWLVGLALPVLTVLWWALHPLNVEAVAWISCRYDLLSGAAVLGLLALPFRPGKSGAVLPGLVFLLGLLSKDGFAPMVAVVLSMDWVERRPLVLVAPRYVAIGLSLALWWGARNLLTLPGFGITLDASLFDHFLDLVRIYSWRALVPPVLSTTHPYTASALGAAIGAAVVLGLVLLVRRHRHLAVPSAVFLAGLIPAALSVPKYGNAAERYFYVPSIGLALLVAELLRISGTGGAAKRALLRLAPVALGLVVFIGLIRLEARLPDFRSDGTLFAAALRVNPLDPQANLQSGLASGQRGDFLEARRKLSIAAQGDPHSARIANGYAWVLLRSFDAEAAIVQAELALKLEPGLPDAWFYLAQARHLNSEHVGELEAYERLLQISPDYPGALGAHAAAISETLLYQGNVAGAIEQGKRATLLAPSLPEAWSVLAFARRRSGDLAGAQEAIEQLMKIAPDYPAVAGAGSIAACEKLLQSGDVAGAITEARKLTERMPTLTEAWTVLAFACHMGNDHTCELQALEQLLRIAPDFPGVRHKRKVAACEVNGGSDCLSTDPSSGSAP